jgi:hypothetical protein
MVLSKRRPYTLSEVNLMKKLPFVVLAIILSTAWNTGRALADPKTEIDPAFDHARKTFYEALDNAELISQAEKEFMSLEQRKDLFPLPAMYSAVIKALKADQSIWPLRKTRLVNEALREIDAVVPPDSKNYELRMLRASMWYELPSFFNRKAQAKQELDDLASTFNKDSITYPDYVRRNWLSFFFENHILKDDLQMRNLYVALGGDLKDLE